MSSARYLPGHDLYIVDLSYSSNIVVLIHAFAQSQRLLCSDALVLLRRPVTDHWSLAIAQVGMRADLDKYLDRVI